MYDLFILFFFLILILLSTNLIQENFSACSILGERNCMEQTNCGWCIKDNVGKCQGTDEKVNCDRWYPSNTTPVVTTPIVNTPVLYDYYDYPYNYGYYGNYWNYRRPYHRRSWRRRR